MKFLESKQFDLFKKIKNKKKLITVISFITIISVIAFLDKVLAVGIVLIAFLTFITFLIFSKLGIKSKTIQWLFLIVILIHFGAVLFIHYANFQPFGGEYGDYILYQQQAQEIAQRVSQGNFSLEGLTLMGHCYSVILGYLYFFTLPEMLIGQLFGVWLVAISVALVYLIVIETGGSKKSAFLIGLITAIYPSYLLFGSLLLKDVFVIPLVLFGLLLTLKLIKNFFWRNFVIFYITIGATIHFRFYIGYALLFTFIPCWLLLNKLQLKKKLIYGIIIIILLGFLPQFFGYGYYGFKTIEGYFSPEKITFYREVAYSPPSSLPIDVNEKPKTFFNNFITKIFPMLNKTSDKPGSDSSIQVNTKAESFIYVLLGPLPWQMQNYRQLFVLIETIPWYFLLFFIAKGIFVTLKRKRIALPLLVFSVLSLGVLALFITNFGIITRIRIPSFIALLCLIPFAFVKKNKEKEKNDKIKVCYVTNIDKSLKFILLNQIKFLKKENHDVCVVCSPGVFVKEIEGQGIKVKTIRFKRKISPFYDLITFLKLYLYFRKEKFDIVHTHTPKPGLLGQLAAKVAGAPIVVNTIHGFYFQKDDSLLKKKFYILIEKIAAKCSDIIFFVNKEDMETANREKICDSNLMRYFGGGINLSKFNLDKFSEEFIISKKKELGLSLNFKIIGIVGRLVKEKGYLDLFQAFKKIIKVFPNTILLVIGQLEPEKSDRFKPDIVKNYGIEKNVIFLGERIDANELYALMDVFVLPSYREGLGISIIEASAMKRSVVATDIRGCREAVENHKTGILVPVKDSEALAQAIIYLLENPEIAREMGRQGREKALKEFDENIVFSRIKTEYERLIKEKLK